MFGGGFGGGGGAPNPFSMFSMPGMGGAQQQGAQGAQQQGGFPFGFPMGMNLEAFMGPDGVVDPLLLQQIFGDGLFFGQSQPQPPPRSGAPPTAAATLRTLPKIKVTAYDIATNEGSECSICLGDLVAGEPALRIPCGHLFHEDCVRDWLKKSNECPVCRFELPTDDAEYERGRQTRMAGRKIRFRKADLDVKSVQELQRLAHFIAVDVRGCLEKNEIVEKIAASPKVQIVQVEAFHPSLSSSAPASGAPTFASSQLDAMSIGEVRAVMQRLGVDDSGCSDKSECIARLALSGRIAITDDRPAGSVEVAGVSASDSGHRPSSAASRPPSAAGAAVGSSDASAQAHSAAEDARPLAARSVGELRLLAKEHGVSLDGCLEKADIVERLRSSPALHGAP